MKPGDLVKQRDMGFPGYYRGIGIVRKIRKKGPAWKEDHWDSVKVYWKEGHKMNDRWMIRGSLEVICESR